MLPYLFPGLSTFDIVADLITHLRTSDTRLRAALPKDFVATNPPPMDHFLARCPTELTVDLLEERLLAAEKSIVAVGAARGAPRTPLFDGSSPSPSPPPSLLLLLLTSLVLSLLVLLLLLVGGAATARAREPRVAEVAPGGVVVEAVEEEEVAEGVVAGVLAGVVASVVAAEGVAAAVAAAVAARGVVAAAVAARGVVAAAVAAAMEALALARDSSSSSVPIHPGSFVSGLLSVGRLGVVVAARMSFAQVTARVGHATSFTPSTAASPALMMCCEEMGEEVERPHLHELLRAGVDIFALDYDAIIAAMYALEVSADGDCYLCVPPDLGIEPAALGASESALSGTAPAEALHTLTIDSGASRCFFRDNTPLTPLTAPEAFSLVDPSGGPVLARSTTVLPCPAVPSGSLSGLHLPSFSTNLVSDAFLQDELVNTFTPGGQRVAIRTCARTGRHLATFYPSARVEPLHTDDCASSGSCYWSLPPLPSSPAPPCLPCVEGRQRAAPHSSSFPPTEAPLQTLHMDVWGPARVCGQGGERYFLLVVEDYSRYTTVFPLRTKGEVPAVLIPRIHAARLQLRRRFQTDLPVLRLHSDRGGEFSSNLLRAFCQGEGILQSFTLPGSPQQNGVAERRIGLVMEIARTSLIHAAAPHFLWPFAVRYATQQLKLWPRVSLPETSPTLRWTGEVGDASVFRVWGARALVRDTSADKLSSRTNPCVFLGFPPDAPGWQFYHPTLRRVLSSQDVTFDESVPFYRLFPYRTAPLPPCRFSSLQVPPVDPLPPQGPAPSATQVLLRVVLGVAELGGAEPASAEPGGAEPTSAEPEGAEPTSAETGGAEPEGARSGGAESAGVPLGLSSRRGPLSPQQLREWLAWRASLRSRAAGAGGPAAGGTRPGGLGAGGVRSGGAAAGGTGAGGPGAGAVDPRVEDSGAGDPGAGGAGSGGAAAGGAGAGGAGAGGAGTGGSGAAGGAGAAGAGGTGTGGTAQPRLFFAPPSPSSLPPPDSVLRQVLTLPSSTGLPLQPGSPLPAPSPYPEQTERLQSAVSLRLVLPRLFALFALVVVFLRVPLPSPPASSLPDVPDPESDLFRAAHPTNTRLLATVVTDPSFESAVASALVVELENFAAARRLDCAASRVAESESAGGLAAAVPHLVAMLLAPEGDPDASDIPTPRSYAEAILGPYSSQWQTAMDAEMASWKSTGVDVVPPPGANIVDGMWILRVKRPPGSPPVFKARYVARGFSQRQGVDFFQTFSPTPKMTTLRVLLHIAAQRDYELHSLDFSTAFLQGSLHEEIWLRRPPGFTGSFPPGTQWSLRRLVYGLRQAPREWHDTLRTTLAALGFAPLTADPSLFLRTDTSLPPFYILVYVDDLVFATADTEALALVKSELQKRHTCTHLGELRSYLGLQITRDKARRTITLTQSHMVQQVLQRFGFTWSSPQSTPMATGHSLSAPPSDDSVEPSGPYLELVGCLMYLMTCTRPDLAYPLSILARYVAPGRH
ncbi:unnamed protein product [Closterium sp. Yama58-4]|nr:unnamed protein product [Closterium sp. Yama58-4]